MTTYLTIMVTALVATQVIRISQNYIQLRSFKGKATDAEVMAMWERLVESIDKLSERVKPE